MPLRIIRQDINSIQVDAIVEASGVTLIGGEKTKIAKTENLPYKYIIHTYAPSVIGALMADEKSLRCCYTESLELAVAYGCQSLAFPLFKCRHKDRALRFAIEAIKEFLFEHELDVYLCVCDKEYIFKCERYDDIKDFIARDSIQICDESFIERTESYSIRDMNCKDRAVPIRRKMARLSSASEGSLRDYLRRMDKSFAEKLFDLIDASAMTDVECYKRANVDKRTFSKIKSNPKTYRPSKQTAVAFAIALKLNLEQTQELLASAGLTLSDSFTFDKIIRYFIQNEIYDIFIINEALFEFDQQLLGSI